MATRKKTPLTGADIDDLAPAKLHAAATKLLADIATATAKIPGLVSMTAEARKVSLGRVKGEAEREALHSIIATCAAFPQFFASLADKDNGKDASKLETQLLSDRLDRAVVLADIGDKLAEVAQLFTDTALAQGELVRPTLSAAYGIGKAQSASDPKVRSTLKKALDHYSAIGKLSAAGRKKKRQTGK